MNFLLEKLYHLKSEVVGLQLLCQSWQGVESVELAFENITRLLNNVQQVVLEQATAIIPSAFFKHQLLFEARMFSPEWAIWNSGPTSVVFCQMSHIPDSIHIHLGNHVKMNFEWVKSDQSLTLLIMSNVADLNLRFSLKPPEFAEKVAAILKCCRESLVFVERRDLTQLSVVKVETEPEPEVGGSISNGKEEMPEPKRERDSPCLSADGLSEVEENGIVCKNENLALNNHYQEQTTENHHVTSKRKRLNVTVNSRKKPQSRQNRKSKPKTPKLRKPDLSIAVKEEQDVGESFQDQTMNDDESKHERDEWLVCRLCGAQVLARSGSDHMIREHEIEKECCFCPDVYLSREEVVRHQLRVHVVVRQSCRFCNKLVVVRRGLSHLRQRHGVKCDMAAECCFCPLKLNSWAKIRLHLRLRHMDQGMTHAKDELRECRICNDLLKREEEHSHMKKMHDRPGECPLCEFRVGQTSKDVKDLWVTSGSTSPEGELKRHLSIVHRQAWTKCGYCKKSFNNPQSVAKHRDSCELRNDAMKKKKEADDKVVCNDCGQLVSKSCMSRHHEIHHNKLHRFACPHCPKRYYKGYSLNRHLMTTHYPEQKKHVCSVCGKAFAAKDGLIYHSKMHEPPSLKCPRENCDKVFKLKRNVLQHLRGKLGTIVGVSHVDFSCVAVSKLIFFFLRLPLSSGMGVPILSKTIHFQIGREDTFEANSRYHGDGGATHQKISQ